METNASPINPLEIETYLPFEELCNDRLKKALATRQFQTVVQIPGIDGNRLLLNTFHLGFRGKKSQLKWRAERLAAKLNKLADQDCFYSSLAPFCTLEDPKDPGKIIGLIYLSVWPDKEALVRKEFLIGKKSVTNLKAITKEIV